MIIKDLDRVASNDIDALDRLWREFGLSCDLRLLFKEAIAETTGKMKRHEVTLTAQKTAELVARIGGELMSYGIKLEDVRRYLREKGREDLC